MELVQPLVEIGKSILALTERHIGYARNLKKNLKELQEKVTELSARRDDIRNEVGRRKMQKDLTKECQVWLKVVDNLENETKRLEEECSGGEKKCFKCLCPGISARIKLGEHVEEMITKANDLRDKSKFEGGFLVELQLDKVEKQLVPTILVKASTDSTLKMVMESIKDVSVQRIGIWGMGGIGKTTIMKLVNNEIEISAMFDVVIFVTVSQSWNIKNLQQQVVQRLPITTDDLPKEEEKAAQKLLTLLEGRKYLLLLDDVWDLVDLNAAGIPNASKENGCKVVLTTRKHDICRKMDTDKDIMVEVLGMEAAWEMFEAVAGEVAMYPTIKPTAKEIVKRCGGLPLALKVAGGALKREENLNVWVSYLMDMKNRATSSAEEMEQVLNSLKVSYHHLKDNNKKKCFLYCGLYPEDHKIKKSELIMHWKAEGFLGTRTLADGRIRGDAILQALVDASLLERCEGNKHVKLHDVIREMVLTITSPGGEECMFLVTDGSMSTEEEPEDEEWKNAVGISLFMDYIVGERLPEKAFCPKLTTLLLRRNHRLRIIPLHFFDHMPNLKVLDLSDTGIEHLPPSVSNLTSLQALLLKRCTCLQELPPEIGGVKKLEVLIVTKCKMSSLPGEIWDLTSLKCIKFQFSSTPIVPSWKISNLRQVEEFAFQKWRHPMHLDDKTAEIVIKELAGLTKLVSLKFRFLNISSLEEFVRNNKSWQAGRLTKFTFYIGETNLLPWAIPELDGWLIRFDYFRKLFMKQLCYDSSILGPPRSRATLQVLQSSEFLELVYERELKVLSDLGAENLSGLKACLVRCCESLEVVIDQVGQEKDTFSNLEYLSLENLKKLSHIVVFQELGLCMHLSTGKSFTNLKDLSVSGSPNIKSLFSVPSRWIQQLSNLEILKIYGCNEMEEIVPSPGHGNGEMQNEEDRGGVVPKLREIDIQSLPKFVNLFQGFSVHWPSLLSLKILTCPKLKKLPLTLDNAPNLKTISGSKEWWEALEWEDLAIKSLLEPIMVGSRF